jgi:hypothetical protein
LNHETIESNHRNYFITVCGGLCGTSGDVEGLGEQLGPVDLADSVVF